MGYTCCRPLLYDSETITLMADRYYEASKLNYLEKKRLQHTLITLHVIDQGLEFLVQHVFWFDNDLCVRFVSFEILVCI